LFKKRGDRKSPASSLQRLSCEARKESSNYQIAIWKQCLEKDPQVSTPVGQGWKIEHEDGVAKLAVGWRDIKATPEAILELLACNYRYVQAC